VYATIYQFTASHPSQKTLNVTRSRHKGICSFLSADKTQNQIKSNQIGDGLEARDVSREMIVCVLFICESQNMNCRATLMLPAVQLLALVCGSLSSFGVAFGTNSIPPAAAGWVKELGLEKQEFGNFFLATSVQPAVKQAL
jgi:hypothetical protein